MRDSIHKFFRVGTLLWMSWPKTDSIEALKKVAQDDFFDAIEVKGFADRKEEAREILQQSHMTVCYGAQPCLLSSKLNPNDLDEEGRLKALAALKDCVDEAEFLGAGGVAFLAGKWQKETKEESYKQLLKTTRSLCDYAAEKGLFVELEIFDYDMEKAVLIGPAPYAAHFAADMRMTHNNFGLLLDLSHLPTTYETSRYAVRVLRPFITHLHFGNAVVKPGCDAYGDKHPRFDYPNGENGVEELLDYLSVLKEEGFFRKNDPLVLSMEVTPRPGEDEDIVLANTKRVLNRAWALLDEI